MAALAAITLLLALAIPGFSETVTYRTIPPDRSLSVSEYQKRGLPPLDAEWTSTQVGDARQLLQDLLSEDPTLLPRFRSGRSGPVFEKLVSASLTLEAAPGMNLNSQQFEAALETNPNYFMDEHLLAAYWFSPDVGAFFDRELVEIARASAENTLGVLEEAASENPEISALLAKATQQEDDEMLERLHSLRESTDRTVEAYVALLLASVQGLADLCSVPEASPSARQEARFHVLDLLRRSLPLLPPSVSQQASDLLEHLRGPKNPCED